MSLSQGPPPGCVAEQRGQWCARVSNRVGRAWRPRGLGRAAAPRTTMTVAHPAHHNNNDWRICTIITVRILATDVNRCRRGQGSGARRRGPCWAMLPVVAGGLRGPVAHDCVSFNTTIHAPRAGVAGTGGPRPAPRPRGSRGQLAPAAQVGGIGERSEPVSTCYSKSR